MENEQFENYYKLPKIILEIMDWFFTTKFYKKTYEERKKYYEEEAGDIKDWMFCDFIIDKGTLEEPEVIRIGEIPSYQGDHEKTIVINLKDKDKCYLRRGYATEPYARSVIVNRYDIPGYMKKDLDQYIDKFNKKEEI